MLTPGQVEIETRLLKQAGVERAWALIERFAGLVRESGSPDEAAAADYIVAELEALGIEYEVHEPELYLSLPRDSSVSLPDADLTVQAKPPSFARPTPPEGVTAPAVYVPGGDMEDLSDIFADSGSEAATTVRGKIVVTDGYAMPLPVERFSRAGAVAQIYINPGHKIHWGICTPIWGTPGEADLDRTPETPVVAISRPDGERLIEALSDGSPRLTVRAALEEGWFPCKLPVATIPGASEDFLLVHGHYDSWDVGVGDNAVGDATLLELARIFAAERDELRRSLRIAWWPGHSTGRYAGSTWYADRFALELRRRCVATVNIDSPGCWKATAYDEVMWMAETQELCRGAIRDTTGIEPGHRRPVRAGDYSFNGLGLTSFFMLLSNIPAEAREALGFYPVGGCGGNIAWHTEEDRLDVADRKNLERDLRVYVTAIARVLNAPVLPFDYRATVAEIAEAVEGYRDEADGLVDLSPVEDELGKLSAALDRFYNDRVAATSPRDAPALDEAQKRLARHLVPLDYAAGDTFHHDPALPLGVVPRLARISELRSVRDDRPERLPFLRAELRRQINHVADGLFQARRAVEPLL